MPMFTVAPMPTEDATEEEPTATPTIDPAVAVTPVAEEPTDEPEVTAEPEATEEVPAA